MAEAISRREFNKRLAMVASGAALFALQPSGSPSRSLPIAQSLRSDLTGLDGALLVDDVARQAAAFDFGRIVGRLPIAVLKAGSVQDVVKTLRFASLHDVRFVEYGARVLATPAESAFAPPRFSVWKTSSSKRPLVRLPDDNLVVRFQISRNLPASADVQSVIVMNRTLYEQAHAMGGTRLTTTAIPFSQADWIRHYGPAWESFRRAKERFDPYNVLTPGHAMFPG